VDSGARARFESKIDRTSESEHWLWTGQLDPDGYPKFNWREPGRRHYERPCRLVLEEKLGRPLGAGMFACHARECRHRNCLKPDHLYEGTARQNSEDMTAGGWQATGDRNGARLYPERLKRGDENWSRRHPERVSAALRAWHRANPGARSGDNCNWVQRPEIRPRGERHPKATVSDAAKAAALLRIYAGESCSALARELGVSKSTVCRWARGTFRAQ